MEQNTSATLRGLALFLLLVLAGAALGWFIIPTPPPEPPGARKPPAQDSTLLAAPGAGQVGYVSDATFGQEVLNSQVPVLVDFYADWCGPCMELAPLLDELAREAQTVKIVRVNVDRETALAARYDVGAIPRLVVFNKGQITADHTGTASKNRLRTLLGL
jgi:thioredoxin 1